MKQAMGSVLCAVGLAGMAGMAHAQACSGFGDVLVSDALVCPAVEWVKNRSVTQGCDTGLYCPTNNVTRAQMAIFMKRLGEKLSPTVLNSQASVGGTTLPAGSAGLALCPSEVIDPAPYPRQALVTSTVSLLATGDGAVSFRAFPMISYNGGTSYFSVRDTSTIVPHDTAAALAWGSVSAGEWIELPANEGPFKFMVSLRRADAQPSTNSTYSTGRCQMSVAIFNSNVVLQ